MPSRPHARLISLVLLAGAIPALKVEARIIDDGPHHKDELYSIGDVLAQAKKREVQILYVHGMAAEGAGDSHVFLTGLCHRLPGCKVPSKQEWKPAKTDTADQGVFAADAASPKLTHLGNLIWKNDDEWHASRPFVDHYVLRGSGSAVVVSEINYWPLLFPVKCREILPGEARMTGLGKSYVSLCSPTPADAERLRMYSWLPASELKSSGRGAWGNYALKNFLMDWGFSDAIMAVGSMHTYFQEGMRQLFLKCAQFRADNADSNSWRAELNQSNPSEREFILVSHSLGSYLAFSTLNMNEAGTGGRYLQLAPQSAERENEKDDAADYIFQHTVMLYFFANQVPLLELADVAPEQEAAPLTKRLEKWRTMRREHLQKGAEGERVRIPPQIVAWSDPDDLFTWRIPQIQTEPAGSAESGELVIDNLYVRNTCWRWLFVSPAPAHLNYARNKAVLDFMVKPTHHPKQP
jgi:hypothetical protein